jgi:ribosome-associated protein
MVDRNLLADEMDFTFSRSSGPGGQNVNKVNSKASATWHVTQTKLLDEERRARFLAKFSSKLRNDWAITISADEFRDRTQNQSACIDRLYSMIEEIWVAPRARKKTRPTRSGVRKRLTAKRIHSEKKKSRGESY